jgi:hypothetical protein
MIEYWGNMIEAVFWILVAAVVYGRSDHKTGTRLGTGEWAAITFFWFGISDLIEVRTGAWYRPLGLLAMKGTCIAVLLILYLRHRRATSGSEGHAADAAEAVETPPESCSDPDQSG